MDSDSDSESLNVVDVEPQLVAEAIAAVFQNEKQELERNSVTVLQRELPGIIFIGTHPLATLYRMLITKKLLDCINHATDPEEKTVVRKLIRKNHNSSKIDSGLDNRKLIFKHFEAIKKIIIDMDVRNSIPSTSHTQAGPSTAQAQAGPSQKSQRLQKRKL